MERRGHNESPLRGAELSGLCDEVRGSDIQRELLAELLLLYVERSRSRRPLIRISRVHTQLGRDPGAERSCAGRFWHVIRPEGSQRRSRESATGEEDLTLLARLSGRCGME